MLTIPTVELTDADSLLTYLSESESQGFHWFRGHESSKWKLQPALLRSDVQRNETNLLKSFWQRASGLSGAAPSTDASAWISIAQHHGLETRVLDWSESFLVALYFALDRPQSTDTSRSAADMIDACIWLLNPVALNAMVVCDTNGVLSETEDLVLLTHRSAVYGVDFPGLSRPSYFAYQPRYLHERMVVQKSAFTWHNCKLPLEEHACAAHFLRGVRIAAKNKGALRRYLSILGVSDSSVFPDFAGVASEMVKRASR